MQSQHYWRPTPKLDLKLYANELATLFNQASRK
jgi:hypothetical protein